MEAATVVFHHRSNLALLELYKWNHIVGIFVRGFLHSARFCDLSMLCVSAVYSVVDGNLGFHFGAVWVKLLLDFNFKS